MRWLAAALAATFLLLQYRIWLSHDGVREVARLRTAVSAQQTENGRLAQRNRELAAEVHDLKNGMAALEERARSELGMIGDRETYFQVVPRSSTVLRAPPARQSAPRTAQR
jgi:cell division protein FtsB